MKTRNLIPMVLALTAGAALLGCSTYKDSGGAPDTQKYDISQADSTIHDYKTSDPSLSKFFDSAYGYAVFPKITKGAAGIGAAHGEGGVVYQHGSVVGYATMTQITLGAQLGGQEFSEIIFFQNQAAFDSFTGSHTEFDANASAVMAHSGGAATADYRGGVAVFCNPIGGAMFEASVGGQKFKYWPK